MDLPSKFAYRPPSWNILILYAGAILLSLACVFHRVASGIGVPLGILLWFCALIETGRRLLCPRFLEVGPDALLLPSISNKFEIRDYRIPYADIKRAWELAERRGPVFMLRTNEHTVAIHALLLPNSSSYVAVRDFVQSRVSPVEQKPSPSAEAGKYGFRCDYVGNGEIYDSRGEILWRVKNDFNGRPHYPYGRFRLCDFVVYDWMDREVFRIKVVRKLVLAHFVMIENDVAVCTLRQRSLFLNNYTLDFASGQKWVFRLPMFSVMFGGLSASGDKIRVRLWTHNVWHVWIDAKADHPQLVAALAFIHRERLRCN